jgi:hypothetical protein
LAVDADTGEVLASDLTSSRTADCARVPELLDQIDDQVATFMVDGAYDAGAVYEAAQEKGGGQRIEVSLACKILNMMTGLGMPDSVRVP